MEAVKPDPTSEEIAAACREIQARWTAAERRKRNVEGSPAAEIAVVAAPDEVGVAL